MKLSERTLTMGAVTFTRLQGDTRRAQIVEVARELFARNGYQTTTTRELARSAGVSDALMYRYFESKADILRAVVDQGIAGFAAMSTAASEGRELPLPRRLNVLGRTFLTTIAAQRDLLVLFVSEHQLLADDARLAAFINLAASGLGAELAERAGAGEVRSDLDGYLFARSFMGALVAFVLLQESLGLNQVHPVDPDAYLAELVGVFVKGTRP